MRTVSPRRLRLALALGAALVLAAPAAAQAMTVYGAASLSSAFPVIDKAPKYNFAGSNQLRLQIERGAPADVFASARPAEPQALFREGRCSRPATFATNVLVLITPRSNPARLRSVYGLRAGGRRLAVGTAGVPIGAYTRQVLRRMRLTSILNANRVSLEPNVNSIVAKGGLGSGGARVARFSGATPARRGAACPSAPCRRGRSPRCATRCASAAGPASTPPGRTASCARSCP